MSIELTKNEKRNLNVKLYEKMFIFWWNEHLWLGEQEIESHFLFNFFNSWVGWRLWLKVVGLNYNERLKNY